MTRKEYEISNILSYCRYLTRLQYAREVKDMVTALCTPRPLNILVCSGSDATLALLKTMLQPFTVKLVSTIDEAGQYLQGFGKFGTPLDFVILDDQTGTHADELTSQLAASKLAQFADTKVIHLYTPTSTSGPNVFATNTVSGVVKMTKPPRLARLLQTLANSKNLYHVVSPHHPTDVSKPKDDAQSSQRTLFGNVLIAEGLWSFRVTLSIHQSAVRQPYCPKSASQAVGTCQPEGLPNWKRRRGSRRYDWLRRYQI